MIEILGIIVAVIVGLVLLPSLLRLSLACIVAIPVTLIVLSALIFLQQTLVPGLPDWAIWGAINNGFRDLLVAHPVAAALVALLGFIPACYGANYLSDRFEARFHHRQTGESL